MKKENKVALKTMAMKSRVVNIFRTEVYPFSENDYQVKYKGKKRFTDEDKIRIFDKIYGELTKTNNELTSYKHKRQYRAFIEAERQKRKNS